MGTKHKGFRLPIEITTKLEELVKTEKYSSESFIVTKALESFFNAEEKGEQKPYTLVSFLQGVLGDELCKKHIDFLEKRRKGDQSLEDVFRNLIFDKGIDLSTEEFLQIIKVKKIDHFYVGKPEPCEYRAIDPEKKKWYCDGKLIPSVVCIAKQQRQLEKGYVCHPQF